MSAPTPLTLRLIDLAATALRYAVPWAALCVVFYLFTNTVTAFACAPDENPWFSLLSNVTRTRAFAFIFGFMGTFYGLQQRNLRRSAVRRLRMRITALEQELKSS